ncbi:MAG: adenosylcobalamin-dependent ribonucleoside-diphosphate reductase [Candidatus Nitrosotenuis sp.]|uniref:Vitamin B12-dependent ribonucleotide reductase n=1 Tax=Candidatus Nitrosotenuis uzonensis TaxID=1407055 RepID=A0A812F129_9ARCH|nr:adenosylcobalamin-dependent ribonucleoside-diphosphate reductase [Candidatus Nitrosotenuis uzonensis]CAE6492271.1 Vitamin B12-dependent ribonucleoside-diphosphate reductase [Candidatus Nitrosotenuis uzonensis]
MTTDFSQIESSIVDVKKRDGRITNFNKEKITNAIYKALVANGNPDRKIAEELTSGVLSKLISQGFSASHPPSVEDVQDMVESTLIEKGYGEIAKSYILYRHERRKVREDKMKVLNTKSLDPVAKAFDLNCLRVLASRYLLRNNKNEIIESPSQMFERVAILVGIGDILYDNELFAKDGDIQQDVEEAKKYLNKLDDFDYKFKIGSFYLNKYHFRGLINHYIYLAKRGQMKKSFKEVLMLIAAKKFDSYADRIQEYHTLMTEQDFLPNSPTMMNAGARLGQLSACFVLGMPDDMADIMKSTSDAALIFKSGGGVGINYSDLRHEGDIVASTSGVASGPVSFMNIINTVTEVVKQGGKRRGANMGILEVWHPDVEKFITNKTQPGVLENFNVSVGVWEDFWTALVDSPDGKYTLRSPRDKAPVREINAHQLIDVIAHSAWKSAEPGLIFFDNINKYNVFAKARGMPLRATNPCGEQSLYPYESCNLGSINLANLVKRKADGQYEFDWQRYEETIRKTTRFLDNVIDMNFYPVPEIDKASKESRRIGLGVMGVADLLYKLRIPYNSKEGYEFQSKLAEALTYYSMEESVALARSRGEFDLCSRTEYPEGKIPISGYYEKPKGGHYYDWDALIAKIQKHGIRNVLTTTVAPTGTLSMIADCSNGMEPTFALVFEKRVTVGRFFYTNKIFEQVLRENGLYSDELLAKIADNYGSVRGLKEVPEWIQNIFVTAMDIHWSDHLMAQAVWQDWIGNAIAKTINMPNDVSADDVKAAYLLAHELGLKGITVYRDGSRHTQVLHMTSENAEKTFDVEPSAYLREYIAKNIKNAYIRAQVNNALELKIPEEPLRQSEVKEEVPEEMLCPSCKNHLVFVEGCSICIECGFSGCTSG